MMPLPHISVIIPSYNAAPYLPETFESLVAQNWPNLEIIVIDDGSTDNTPALIPTLPLPVLYLRQDNAGVSAARNTGLARATGELIAFLDADDIWPADKLRRQWEHLRQTGEDMSLGKHQVFRARAGTRLEDRDYEFGRSTFMWQMGCALYRRALFQPERVGLFNTNLGKGEDMDWFCRAMEQKVSHSLLPEDTLLYRHHSGGITATKTENVDSFLAIAKLSLNRRRKAAAGSPVKPLAWNLPPVPEEN